MRSLLSTLVLLVVLLAGCSAYDPYRLVQTERHKQNAHEGITRARDGKLTRAEYESILQSFDTSMLEEQAKDGKGLEELKAKLDSDSAAKVAELFGEE